MYHKFYNGTWSTIWEDLGGVFISAPTVVSVSHPPSFMRLLSYVVGHGNSKLNLQWGANRLDIFGVGTDSAAYTKSWNGATWSAGWTRLG